jgi:DNA-nicking Smr family endonuclease
MLFDEAMRGVVPRRWGARPPAAAATETEPRSSTPPPDESEDRRLFEAAIDGEPGPVPLDHPEYIEGWVGVAGRLLLPNLRSGLYSIQGQLDLHGMGRDEARDAVTDFIFRMARFRSCCVKIIHGRGINSPGEAPVLKEHLQRWLSTRRFASHVVAYASAPARDGGVGAVYVLLRR